MAKLGWEAEGIEPDAAAARVASAAGHRVTSTPVENAELPSDAYDAITLSHVLEHVPDPPAVLAKLCRALRPGGTLISISPNPVGFVSRWYGKDWVALDPPRHLVLPSPAGYRQMLTVARGAVNVSTLQRAGWAAVAQSLSVQRYGTCYHYRGKLYPKWLDGRIALAMLLQPDRGNEVLCVFTRKW
jgi:SAM-dependent methyltransferase